MMENVLPSPMQLIDEMFYSSIPPLNLVSPTQLASTTHHASVIENDCADVTSHALRDNIWLFSAVRQQQIQLEQLHHQQLHVQVAVQQLQMHVQHPTNEGSESNRSFTISKPTFKEVRGETFSSKGSKLIIPFCKMLGYYNLNSWTKPPFRNPYKA